MEGWLLCLHVVVGIKIIHSLKERHHTHTHIHRLSSQWAGEEAPSPATRAQAGEIRGANTAEPSPFEACRIAPQVHWAAGIPREESPSSPAPASGLPFGPSCPFCHEITFSRAIRAGSSRAEVEGRGISPLSSLCFGWHLQQGHQTGLPLALHEVSMGLQLVASGDNHHSPSPTLCSVASCYCSPLGDCITTPFSFQTFQRPSFLQVLCISAVLAGCTGHD